MACHFLGDAPQCPARYTCVAMTAHDDHVDIVGVSYRKNGRSCWTYLYDSLRRNFAQVGADGQSCQIFLCLIKVCINDGLCHSWLWCQSEGGPHIECSTDNLHQYDRTSRSLSHTCCER